jgi:AmmeMemoRadiSam system protein B
VAGARTLVAKHLAVMDDGPHAPEHSLEVQLPFLQRMLGTFRLLPIAVGVSSVDKVAACLDGALSDAGNGGRTVVICSTDLSHYLDEESANARDERTVGAVCDLAPERIAATDACGVYALRGLLGWARSSKLRPAAVAPDHIGVERRSVVTGGRLRGHRIRWGTTDRS